MGRRQTIHCDIFLRNRHAADFRVFFQFGNAQFVINHDIIGFIVVNKQCVNFFLYTFKALVLLRIDRRTCAQQQDRHNIQNFFHIPTLIPITIFLIKYRTRPTLSNKEIPFGSLLAFKVTAKSPKREELLKAPARADQ